MSIRKRHIVKIILMCLLITGMIVFSIIPVFAAGDVSTAIQSTWTKAQTQIKNVVNNVVFPVVDMILAILFFVKLGTAYFDCAPVKVL